MDARCRVGDLVEIHQVILPVGERAAGVPDDTSKVPLEAWIKGRARGEAAVGEEVEIETQAGRIVTGTLTRLDPGYAHTYGPLVPELAPIAQELRAMLKRGRGV
ncbi:MAG: 2-amino-4-oxopentanoate thiolase subunit OrtA [Bacillota bacterium]